MHLSTLVIGAGAVCVIAGVITRTAPSEARPNPRKAKLQKIGRFDQHLRHPQYWPRCTVDGSRALCETLHDRRTICHCKHALGGARPDSIANVAICRKVDPT